MNKFVNTENTPQSNQAPIGNVLSQTAFVCGQLFGGIYAFKNIVDFGLTHTYTQTQELFVANPSLSRAIVGLAVFGSSGLAFNASGQNRP